MPEAHSQRGKRKTRVGFVISDAMNKTVIVRVQRRVRHPLYGKEIRIAEKFYAHDEDNAARVGDQVEIVETRPLSSLKRWRMTRILNQISAPQTADLVGENK